MKIFGTISPWVEIEDSSLKMGRYVANNDFLRALFLFTDFDEYHFYVFNKYFYDITIKYFKNCNDISPKLDKIKIFYKKDLINNIKNIEYYVFHQGGWYIDLPNLIYIRNKYAKNIFPITGIIHSINDFNTLTQTVKFASSPYTKKDAIFATSTCGKKAMENYFTEAYKRLSIKKEIINMPVIPLGYNIDLKNSNDISKSNARNILDIPQNRFTILYLGRLSLSTKLDLTNMLFQLKKYIYNDNFNIILAGGATDKDRENLEISLKQLNFENRIKIFYNFHTNQKTLLYKASDIFLSPIDNLQETFGITIPEAKMFGVVPIVSDWNGYKDTVRDGIDGFRIPTYSTNNNSDIDEIYELIGLYDYHYYFEQTVYIDYNILREKIDYLYNNPDILKRMSMKAKSHAQKIYSWKNIILQYMKQWKELNKIEIEQLTNLEFQLKINFKDIFNSYYEDLQTEKLTTHEDYLENFEFVKKLYINIFFNINELENLINIAKNSTLYFNQLSNNEKNIALFLLKWNILKIIN